MPGNRTSSSCLTRLRRETVKQVNLFALNGLRQAVVLRPIDRPKIPHPSAVTFEPFFTTKAEGMGMGLSVARTSIEAYGSQIFAENQAGGGAIFRIECC